MTLALISWAVASAGHAVLLAAILNRLQGFAIPPRILHPVEKVLLLAIVAGPPIALLAILFVDPLSDSNVAAAYRVWAIVAILYFFAWAFGRLTRQVVRALRMGPVLRRRRTTHVSREEALHRERWTWRLATALPGNEALKLVTVRTRIEIPQATAPRERLRVVHLSDLHLSGTLSKAFYRRAIDAALAERPHAFLLTGDLVEAEECLEWVDELFRPLAETAPSWFVLGNHDGYLPRPEELVERLERAGVRSLVGREERVRLADWDVRLLGDSAPWFAGFPPDDDASRGELRDPPDLTIALMHTPDRWSVARQRGVDLALAGHTHGGQIRFPIFGPMFCPSRSGTRFSRGWFACGERRMFVSQGVAGVIPIRYLCPPEIVRIEALPASQIELPKSIDETRIAEAEEATADVVAT